MPRAIVKLLPGMTDLSSSMGTQMAQAMSAFGMQPPGGRVPVDVPKEDLEFVVEGAVRSENHEGVIRFFDAHGDERALVPLHRVDTVRYDTG